MLQLNLNYLLEKKSNHYPNDIAIFDADGSKAYTYNELCQRVRRMANALKDLGINKGDRICCLTANTLEYLDLFMAAARLGILLVPINYRLAPSEMIRIINDAKPMMFIFDSEFGDAAKEIANKNSDLKKIIFFGNGKFSWANRMEELMLKDIEVGPEIVGDSEDPVLMLYTAGSTGTPKGVPLKQRHLFFQLINMIIDWDINKKDYHLLTLPFFHIGGNLLLTLPHLFVGAKVCLQRRFDAEKALRLISQEKITNMFVVPTLLKMMSSIPNWESYDLSSLRFIGSGGEPMSEKTANPFTKKGITVFNGYGLTEAASGVSKGMIVYSGYGLTEAASGVSSVCPETVLRKPANCIGQPLTFPDVRIVDKNGREVNFGVVGEMIVKGSSVADAYWNRPEESAKSFRDGWLHTGDLAVKDEEGFIYFIGRKDDLIVTGGENVYPAEVEEVIMGYHKVANVAVIPVLGEKWGQTVKAVIEPKVGMTIGEQEIRDYIKPKLGGFKRPKIIEFVESLPKLGSGKVDRTKIKNVYGK